ncbi:MAG TPA: family 10 glycosylhydrolase [Flavisolibacter sp.]|nr:family 10 glycosylhydrolase [Flavisolibacter sp.]
MHKIILQTCLLICLFILAGCGASRTSTKTITSQPGAEREFRAAWVATVANINWPSKPGLPVDSQQKEAIALLDFLKSHNFNAVVFQVRPQADALYQSSLEPWSYYLTGTQGKAPEPFYDPLQFWIEAAHDRGLELHVWLNPYRAHHPTGGPVTESSLVKRKPELVVHLKEGYWWFDPSLEGTKAHATAVVKDLVKRYDIDGIHFDDYFYPYPEYNKKEDFPDSTSWKLYLAGGGKLSRGDWRREAVNSFIDNLYKEIKKEKKHVKFGLSPFGIWRPGYPEGICCFDQYEVLYADAKLWLNKGWIDYFSPQLYWPITRMNVSFPVLLGWWKDENTKARHLWPGINVGADTSARNVTEVMNQVMVSRGMLPESKGVIHWSIGQVFRNANIAKSLVDGPYKNGALVPESKWLDKKAPTRPRATSTLTGDSISINWSHPQEDDVFRWVVYFKYDGGNWNYKILNRKERGLTVPVTLTPATGGLKVLSELLISAVDRVGNESEKTPIPFSDQVPFTNIVPRSGWSAAGPKPFKQHTPVRITVHHEGTKLELTANAARKIKAIQTWGMGPDRNWADIPYHFLIAPDGTVYEGRNVNTVGETATEYDPEGHLLITCLGNLEVQEVTPQQLSSLTKLIAYCSRKYHIPIKTLATHRDYSKQTTCPGKNLYTYFQNGSIKQQVEQLLKN